MCRNGHISNGTLSSDTLSSGLIWVSADLGAAYPGRAIAACQPPERDDPRADLRAYQRFSKRTPSSALRGAPGSKKRALASLTITLPA